MKLEYIHDSLPAESKEAHYLQEVCLRVDRIIGVINSEVAGVALINFLALHTIHFDDEFIINDDCDLTKTLGYELASVAMAALCESPKYKAEEWKDIRLNFNTTAKDYEKHFDEIFSAFLNNEHVDTVE